MSFEESEPMEQKTFFIRAEVCTGCGLCQLACSLVKAKEANPARSRIFIERLVMDGIMMPHICLNCAKPPCIEACRRKAINKDARTGWVTIDKDRCNDCTLCIAACPYLAITLTPEHEVLLCDVCEGNPRCVAMCPTGAIQFADRVHGIAGTTDTAVVDIFRSK
jgi:carbon-monoxide dehydrogenase iron sulfur subunit